jgi:hypothetical protein
MHELPAGLRVENRRAQAASFTGLDRGKAPVGELQAVVSGGPGCSRPDRCNNRGKTGKE